MSLRIALALVAVAVAAPSVNAAETVLFETNAGSFEVELNPTDNPDLQTHVDNFLQYVDSGRWVGAVINRTVQNFVVQLGSFRTDSIKIADLPTTGLPSLPSFDPVIVDADFNNVIDFDTTGLSNTRGEISLALNSTGPNSGTSSWFVNLDSNTFLDPQGFIPFARINDLTFFDELVNGPQQDLSQEAGQPGSLAYTDVPVVNGGEDFVVINGVRVVPEPSSLMLILTAAVFATRRRS